MAEILFIEDQPEVISGLKRMLERRKHHVTIVGSGRETIRRLKERQPDVIVTDIVLPKGEQENGSTVDLEQMDQQVFGQNAPGFLDGMEGRMGLLILHQMVDAGIQTPVIVLSAYLTREITDELEKLKTAGLQIARVFPKPAKASEVIGAIEDALKTKVEAK